MLDSIATIAVAAITVPSCLRLMHQKLLFKSVDCLLGRQKQQHVIAYLKLLLLFSIRILLTRFTYGMIYNIPNRHTRIHRSISKYLIVIKYLWYVVLPTTYTSTPRALIIVSFWLYISPYSEIEEHMFAFVWNQNKINNDNTYMYFILDTGA